MAVDLIQWHEFDEETQSGFNKFKVRVYAVGDHATLSDVSLEVGSNLPEDSTYEIVSSSIEFLKRRNGPKPQSGQAARVKAVAEDTEADLVTNFDWAELSGTRTKLDTDPQLVQYQIQFTGDTGSTAPSPGDSLNTIIGGSVSLPSTGLDREPVAIRVSEVVKSTTQKSHVTVIFQAHHARVSSGSPFTEVNPRQLIRTGQRSWRGRRRFIGPSANAEALTNGLYNSVFPTKSGKYAPKCIRVETNENIEPGIALVVADYETPRVVGEGILRVQTSFQAEAATQDLDKAVMVGPEETTVGSTKRIQERRIVKGSAVRLMPKSKIVLETAATSLNVNTFMNLTGCVNKYSLPNFGNAQPGTLLFLGLPDSSFKLVGNLWYLNLAFSYSGDPEFYAKWNQQTESQPGNYFPVKLTEVTEGGAVVEGSTKTILEWQPYKRLSTGARGGENARINHKIYPEKDFRFLGKDLVITGIK